MRLLFLAGIALRPRRGPLLGTADTSRNHSCTQTVGIAGYRLAPARWRLGTRGRMVWPPTLVCAHWRRPNSRHIRGSSLALRGRTSTRGLGRLSIHYTRFVGFRRAVSTGRRGLFLSMNIAYLARDCRYSHCHCCCGRHRRVDLLACLVGQSCPCCLRRHRRASATWPLWLPPGGNPPGGFSSHRAPHPAASFVGDRAPPLTLHYLSFTAH